MRWSPGRRVEPGGGLPTQSAWSPLIGPTPRWSGQTRSAARLNPGHRTAARRPAGPAGPGHIGSRGAGPAASPQDFDSCLQTGGSINPPRPELAALGQLLDGGGHHLGRQASGGPLLRLDGIRLQLKHAVQVEDLGVFLDGGGRRPSPAVGRGQAQVFPCRLEDLLGHHTHDEPQDQHWCDIGLGKAEPTSPEVLAVREDNERLASA